MGPRREFTLKGVFEYVLLVNFIIILIFTLGIQLSLVFAEGEPVANAGPDQVVNELTEVMLNGTGSSSPSGIPMAIYEWIQTDSNQIVPLNGNGTSVATFLAPKVASSNPTIYTFRLIVTDSNGMASAAPDDVSITVNHLGGKGTSTMTQNPTMQLPELKEKSLRESVIKSQPLEQGQDTDTLLSEQTAPIAETSPPKLIETSPSDGATDVSVTKPKITAKFDKDIDIASAAFLVVDDNGNQVELKGDPQLKGTTLTILPSSFSKGAHYTVSFDGIKDAAGNQASYKISFSTVGALSEKKGVSQSIPGQDMTKEKEPGQAGIGTKSSEVTGTLTSQLTNASGKENDTKVKESQNQTESSPEVPPTTPSSTTDGNKNSSLGLTGTPPVGAQSFLSSQIVAKFTSNDVIEIPIISFKWGGSAPVDKASGLSSGKLQYEPITLTHIVDQYTPAIFKKFTDHRQINSLEITVKSTGQEYIKFGFYGGTISSVKQLSSGYSYPVEEIGFRLVGNLNPKGGALGGAGGGQPTIEFNSGGQVGPTGP